MTHADRKARIAELQRDYCTNDSDLPGVVVDLEEACDGYTARIEALTTALRDLTEACTDVYKAARIPAEPFVRALNVLAAKRRTS